MKEEHLIKLTNFWYEYVRCDHHKDRDCHFYINKKWSYGQRPVYYVEHNGYMSKFEEDKEWVKYEDALDELILFLEKEIKEVYENIPENYNDTTHWDYNFQGVVKVCKKYNFHPITVDISP